VLVSFLEDCRKSPNVAILENSRKVRSTTYVSQIKPFQGFSAASPVIHSSKSTRQIEDFNPKSINRRGNRRKILQLLKCADFLIKSNLLGHQSKTPVGKHYILGFIQKYQNFEKLHSYGNL